MPSDEALTEMGRDIEAYARKLGALAKREPTGNAKEQLNAAYQCLEWARDHVSRAKAIQSQRALYVGGYATCPKCGTKHDRRRRCPKKSA